MILSSLPIRFAGMIAVSAVFSVMAHAGPGSVETAIKFAGDAVVADFDNFGSAVANLGDLDGDGVDDMAVGAFGDNTGGSNRGAVHILFFNANRTVKANTKIADGNSGGLPMNTLADNDLFGSSLTGLGDLDGDGVPDLAVGAFGDGTGGGWRGAAYILFLNANGTVKTFAKIADGNSGGLPMNTLANDDEFGRSVSRLDDLDGDGVPELAVGAWRDDTGGGGRGAAYILFLNANGTVKAFTKIADGNLGGLPMNTLANGDLFGRSISNIGDIDGDCIPDLAVGAEEGGGIDRGALHLVFLNANGTVKETVEIADDTNGLPDNTLSSGDRFGVSVTSLGDLNGDGVPDLAVGAEADDTGGGLLGAVYILFLKADGTLKDHNKIADNNGLPMDTLTNSDLFGHAVSSLGDLDGDGLPELAVGTIGDDTGGPDRGAVYLLEIGNLPFTVTTADDEFDNPSLDGSGERSLREAIRDADAANSGEFRTIDFAPGLNGDTITLTMGQLDITDQALKITGAGLASGVTISGGGLSRVFEVDSLSSVTLESLSIVGGKADDGASGTFAGSGESGGGVFNRGRIKLSNVTIADNVAGNGGGASGASSGGAAGGGGGIYNDGGSLVLVNSTISRNIAGDGAGPIGSAGGNGGGILNNGGVLWVLNSTIVGNIAGEAGNGDGGQGSGGRGGGIYNDSGTLSIKHSTISVNSDGLGLGSDGGGGIYIAVGSTTSVSNTIIAGNLVPSGRAGPDIFLTQGQFISTSGHNLIGNNSTVSNNFDTGQPNLAGDFVGTPAAPLSPNLAALADNGGKTLTMEPLPGSLAIDMATFIPLPTTDQRGAGFHRTVGAGADIGAVEFVPAPPVAAAAVSPVNNALRTSLNSKIKKLKKKIKTAKKKGQKAKAKKLTTKLKKLIKKLKAL